MSTEGKRLRYNEFIIFLSIPKGSVDMKSYWLEKSDMRVLLLHLKLDLSTPLVFSFLDTLKNKY